MKQSNREEAANFLGRYFISKCKVQKFYDNGKFFTPSRIYNFVWTTFQDVVRRKYQKIQKVTDITVTATKIVYFVQFGMFGDIRGSRQSQIDLFINSLSSID